MMRLRRNASVLAVATALMLSATGCGGDDVPTAEPTETTTSATPTESTSPTETETAWQDKYTEAQLDAYEAALSRYKEYETRSEPIWAEGKVTDRAEALFKQYYPSPLWQGRLRLLASYEAGNVQVEGTPGVYWSKAKSISDSGRSVVINQCVDYTQGKTTQNGKDVEAPAWVEKPNLRTINLEKPDGSDWLIYGVVDASGGKARPCTP